MRIIRHIRTKQSRGLFEVLHASWSVQAAMMTLRPGGVSDEKVSNEHPRSEQWVFVLTGSGVARVGKRRVRLREHSLLLIEKGEIHQITNTGQGLLRTINFYAPPAYTSGSEIRK